MVAEVGALQITLQADAQPLVNGFTRAEQATSRFGAKTAVVLNSTALQTDRLRAKIAGIGPNLTAAFAPLTGLLGGLGIGVGLASAASALGNFIDEASKIVNVADRVGVTTDAMQELTHAAKLADIEFGTLEKSLQIFGRMVGEATAGKGELAKVLAANNVALRDENGQVRSANDLLRDYADLIKNAKSEQERLTLAQIAFGRGGAEMVTMLRDGSQGLRDTAKEARDLGLVLDEDLLRKTEEVGDKWTTLTTRMSTAFKSFVLDVANGAALTIEDLQRLNAALTNAMSAREQAGATGAFVGGLYGQKADFASGPTPKTTGELLAALGMTPPAAPATILPGSGGGSGSGGDNRAERERQAVDNLISSLQRELELINATDVEREVSNALRQAGASIRGLRIEPFIEPEWHRNRIRVGFRMPLEKTAETSAAFGKIMSNFRVNRREVMAALLEEMPQHAWWNYQTMKAR